MYVQIITNYNIVNSDYINYCSSNDNEPGNSKVNQANREDKTNEIINMDKGKNENKIEGPSQDQNKDKQISEGQNIIESKDNKKSTEEMPWKNPDNGSKGKRNHDSYDEQSPAEEMNWETTGNDQTKDKGKGKRNYDSFDEEIKAKEESNKFKENEYDYRDQAVGHFDKPNISEESNKNTVNKYDYRDKAEESDSSDSSQNESEYSDKSEDSKPISIIRRPDIIDDEIKNYNDDLELIEKAKNLDSKLPPSQQLMNDSVSKLSKTKYSDWFQENTNSVKESLENLERYVEDELYAAKLERASCTTIINAEGSVIKTWDGKNMWVETTQEVRDSLVNNEDENSEVDVYPHVGHTHSDKSENSKGKPDESSNENNSPKQKENEDNSPKKEGPSEDNSLKKNEGTNNSGFSSPNDDLTKNSSTMSETPNKSILPTNVSPSTGSSLNSDVSNPTNTANPADAADADTTGTLDATDATKSKPENKKPTPGDFIDDLPQDMPSFSDDFD